MAMRDDSAWLGAVRMVRSEELGVSLERVQSDMWCGVARREL